MRDFHHPLEGKENGQDCFLSANLFFCLLQVYRDFLKSSPWGDAIRYYDVYIEVGANKKVLTVLLSVKPEYVDVLPSGEYHAYHIQGQKCEQGDALKQRLSEEKDPHDFSLEDNFGHLTCSAVMLKQLDQAYRIFLHKSQNKVSLRLNRFRLTLFRDNSTFVVLTQSWLWTNPDDWMDYEELDGVDDYVIFDLNRPKQIVMSFSQHWRNRSTKLPHNRHCHKSKRLAEEKQQENPHD